MESQCSLGWSGMDHLFSTTSLWSQRALVLSSILGPMKNITDWTKLEKEILDDYAKTLCHAVEKDKALLVIEFEGLDFTKLKGISTTPPPPKRRWGGEGGDVPLLKSPQAYFSVYSRSPTTNLIGYDLV